MIFWMIAGLMSALALAFVIPPLLRSSIKSGPAMEEANIAVYQQQADELETEYKNQSISDEQYRLARADLESGLLQDLSDAGDPALVGASQTRRRWTATTLALAVPILAVLLYINLGHIDAITNKSAQQPTQADSELPSVEQMVNKLVERLQTEPNNGQGWLMLGRSYAHLQRYDDADKALARARQLLGDQPDLLADHAEILAAKNNNQFSGEPVSLINKALQLNPANQKALWLAGHAAVEQGNRQQAIKHWSQLLSTLPADSDAAATVKQVMANIKSTSGQQQAAAPNATTASGPMTRVRVSVTLDKALTKRMAPTDTLFVYARAKTGPRMPLAIVRKQARELPLTVTLDDSMAMMPNMTLSSAEQVIVGARISRSGNAIAQSGDLQGQSKPVSPKTIKQLQITISDIVP